MCLEVLRRTFKVETDDKQVGTTDDGAAEEPGSVHEGSRKIIIQFQFIKFFSWVQLNIYTVVAMMVVGSDRFLALMHLFPKPSSDPPIA